MRQPGKLMTLTGAMLLTAAIAACDRDGPAERAGEKIDNAVENTGEAVENTGDNIQRNTNN